MTDTLRDEYRPGLRGRVEQKLGRSSRSPIGLWVSEIDRVVLLLALLMMAVGLVAVAAASPATAVRYSGGDVQFEPFHYFWRQLAWVGVAVPVMIAVSMLPLRLAKRLALIGALIFFVALAAVPFIGSEGNGARRWIGMGIAQFQPSEFLKPLFVVVAAWLLSFKDQDSELPVITLTALMTSAVGGLLMLQPDFGQTIIFGTVWLLLLIVAGISARTIGTLIGVGMAGLVAGYFGYDNGRLRINAFLGLDGGSDSFQTDMAHATLTAGGALGTGPGGGTVKFKLPEAHTDYIFSVIGEEFGLAVCAVVAVLYLAVVVRVLLRLLEEEDAFRLLAAAGLASQFGLQALINMAVNTGLAPPKGMTLPFISYGGSSMIALALSMGLLLAFTRRNPYLSRSTYGVKRSGG